MKQEILGGFAQPLGCGAVLVRRRGLKPLMRGQTPLTKAPETVARIERLSEDRRRGRTEGEFQLRPYA
jgi:hypothetical protein